MIMTKDLGLRWRKVKDISCHENSVQNLVLRQQFAIQMLELLSQGKRVFNVDESWVDQLNFTRNHWRPRMYPITPKKEVNPRVSLIACVGTDGSQFLSLT